MYVLLNNFNLTVIFIEVCLGQEYCATKSSPTKSGQSISGQMLLQTIGESWGGGVNYMDQFFVDFMRF